MIEASFCEDGHWGRHIVLVILPYALDERAAKNRRPWTIKVRLGAGGLEKVTPELANEIGHRLGKSRSLKPWRYWGVRDTQGSLVTGQLRSGGKAEKVKICAKRR